ncbi:MAG TPA: tetratricopeptide repeat protein, partial [bacterium]
MQTNRRHPFGIFSTAVLFIYALWFPGFSQESSEKQDFEFGQKLVHEGLFDLAVIQFARFVKDFPSSPRAGDAQFGVAESQFAMNRFNDARLSYITVLLEYPTHPQLDKAQFRIAECFEKEGASHQAMESYGRVHQYYPKSVYVNESLYRAARLAEGAGLYDNATSILQLLLEMEPTGETRSKALFLLSRIKLVKEEYETAVALLEPLANRPIRDRDAVNALIAIGQAYERQGRFEESLSQYEKAAVSTKALDLAAVAQWYRGNLLSLQGSDQEAAVAFAKAEEGLTDSSLKIQCVQASAQTAFRLGRYAAAREKWESLGQTIGFEDRLFKGQNDERLNRLTDAEQAYASLLADSLCPSDLRKKSMLFLAHLFSRTNRVERAIVFYNRFLKSYPDDPLADVVLFQKGKIYLDSLDSAADAEAAFQQLCEGYPDSRLLPASRFLLAEKNVEL